MSPFSFLATCLIFVGVASAQCAFVSTVFGQSINKSPVGTCIPSSFTTGSYKLLCSGATVTQERYTTADCTGTPTSSDVSSSYDGPKQCTGASCTISRISYAGKDCTGATTTSITYVDTNCSANSQEFYCDSGGLYYYSFGDTDAQCVNNQSSPGALIFQYPTDTCASLTSTNTGPNNTVISSTSYFKYTTCTLPASVPRPTLTLSQSFSLSQYKGVNSACSGVLEQKTQVRQLNKCNTNTDGSSSRSYCSGNGGAFWNYGWAGAGCTGKLDVAFYYNTGCIPTNGPFGFGSLSNTSSFAIGCTGVSPPTIDFGGAPYAVIEIYLDSACASFAYGAYVRADGTCEPQTDSTSNATKATCTANGGVNTVNYNTTNCAAGSEIPNPGTSAFNAACTKVPDSDINGNAIYAKVTSCGATGVVNPANAPSIQTLNGAVSKGVGFWFMVVVFGHVLAGF